MPRLPGLVGKRATRHPIAQTLYLEVEKTENYG